METNGTDIIKQNKIIVWIALATGLLLSVPLVAMPSTCAWAFRPSAVHEPSRPPLAL